MPSRRLTQVRPALKTCHAWKKYGLKLITHAQMWNFLEPQKFVASVYYIRFIAHFCCPRYTPGYLLFRPTSNFGSWFLRFPYKVQLETLVYGMLTKSLFVPLHFTRRRIRKRLLCANSRFHTSHSTPSLRNLIRLRLKKKKSRIISPLPVKLIPSKKTLQFVAQSQNKVLQHFFFKYLPPMVHFYGSARAGIG